MTVRVAVVTPAQRAVIGELAADGAINRDIAERLGLSEHTVKSHIKGALQASGCTNRTELVVALLRGRVKLRTEDTRGTWDRP